MNAKRNRRNERLQDLQRQHVHVRKTSDIRWNSGSESSPHFLGKALAGHLMRDAGWVVNSEVEIHEYEADVVCWGREGYLSYVIELETDPEDGWINEKLEKYIYNSPLGELVPIVVNEIPRDHDAALAYLDGELPV